MSLETIADRNYLCTQPAERSFVAQEGFAIKTSLEGRIKKDGNEDKTQARTPMFPPFGVHVPNVPRDAQGFRKQQG